MTGGSGPSTAAAKVRARGLEGEAGPRAAPAVPREGEGLPAGGLEIKKRPGDHGAVPSRDPAWRLKKHSRWFGDIPPPPTPKRLSPLAAWAPGPLRSPGYSPVRGGRRHPGARKGCAAQAAGRAERWRRRCPRRGTGAGGRRGGDSGGGGAGSSGRGGRRIPSCCAARAHFPSPARLKRLLLPAPRGREARGRGGGTRQGGGEAKGGGEQRGETGDGRPEWGGGREARASPAKVRTRKARGGDLREEVLGLSPAPHLLSPPSPFAPFPWALPPVARAGGGQARQQPGLQRAGKSAEAARRPRQLPAPPASGTCAHTHRRPPLCGGSSARICWPSPCLALLSGQIMIMHVHP